MKITAERREAGKFTYYTVMIASAEGRDPFLTLKDLRIVDGQKGRFVGFPARKDDAGKYWPYVYASDAFQAECLRAMDTAETRKDTRTLSERKKPQTLAEMDDDIPW